MNTFHQLHSYTKFSPKKLKIPPNLSQVDSLYSQSYCIIHFCFHTHFLLFLLFSFSFFVFFFFLTFSFFSIHHFLDLGVQTFLSEPIFPFSQCTNIYTPLATVLILTTNEMSIISRFRQFMVFRAVRVKSNVGFKKKFHMVFFFIRLKKVQMGYKLSRIA